MEEGINETRDTVNQLADQFQRKAYIRKCGICEETSHSKGSCPNRLIAQSNFTRLYLMLLKLIVPQCTPPASDDDNDNNGGNYEEEIKKWYDSSVKKNRYQ